MTDEARAEEARRQAEATVYLWPSLRTWQVGPGPKVTGQLAPSALVALRADPRFVEGPLHLLHDVGAPKTEFRSERGAFGRGSLQVVVNTVNGRCVLDVDRFSPYDDVVGFLGHTGEVVVSGWRRVRRWWNGK